jgi:hypothetical protein
VCGILVATSISLSMDFFASLCKGNYAVSGSSAACDVVAEIAKPDYKARMTVKLAVAGAFHTGTTLDHGVVSLFRG